MSDAFTAAGEVIPINNAIKNGRSAGNKWLIFIMCTIVREATGTTIRRKKQVRMVKSIACGMCAHNCFIFPRYVCYVWLTTISPTPSFCWLSWCTWTGATLLVSLSWLLLAVAAVVIVVLLVVDYRLTASEHPKISSCTGTQPAPTAFIPPSSILPGGSYITHRSG